MRTMSSRSSQIVLVRPTLVRSLTDTLNSTRVKRQKTLPKIQRISQQELKNRSTDFVSILVRRKDEIFFLSFFRTR